MRVIAGTARGRRLKEPEGRQIRPTTDKVKEAVFSAIQFEIEGRRVLDLFAGTVQLGIEALSRGARQAVFTDESPAALRIVQENVESCGFSDRAVIRRGDGVSYLKSGEKFDIIFLDPPYGSGLAEKALETIIQFDILNENGIIVCESGTGLNVPESDGFYFKRRQYRYGKITVDMFSRWAGV